MRYRQIPIFAALGLLASIGGAPAEECIDSNPSGLAAPRSYRDALINARELGASCAKKCDDRTKECRRGYFFRESDVKSTPAYFRSIFVGEVRDSETGELKGHITDDRRHFADSPKQLTIFIDYDKGCEIFAGGPECRPIKD